MYIYKEVQGNRRIRSANNVYEMDWTQQQEQKKKKKNKR